MKMLYVLTGSLWVLFLLTWAMCFDTRRPMSQKLKDRCRVREHSVLRKIIKWKDRENAPCNYFKIVPFYVFLLLAVFGSILLLVDVFADGLITNTISENAFLATAIGIFGVSTIYFLAVTIWWEIVDAREVKLKFSKEETKQLKKLVKERRKTKNGKETD